MQFTDITIGETLNSRYRGLSHLCSAVNPHGRLGLMPAQQYYNFQLLTVCTAVLWAVTVSRAELFCRYFRFSCFRSGRFLHSVDASWSLGVTSYGRSNLNKAEQQTLAGGPVEEFLSTSLKGRRYVCLKVVCRSFGARRVFSFQFCLRDTYDRCFMFPEQRGMFTTRISPTAVWCCSKASICG